MDKFISHENYNWIQNRLDILGCGQLRAITRVEHARAHEVIATFEMRPDSLMLLHQLFQAAPDALREIRQVPEVALQLVGYAQWEAMFGASVAGYMRDHFAFPHDRSITALLRHLFYGDHCLWTASLRWRPMVARYVVPDQPENMKVLPSTRAEWLEMADMIEPDVFMASRGVGVVPLESSLPLNTLHAP